MSSRDERPAIWSAPAFPQTEYSSGLAYADGMTLRDYFAAHAPAEPWPHFMPVMPPKPTQPPSTPIGNNGEAADDVQRRNLEEWLCDGCWEPAETEGYEHFSLWCKSWGDYYAAVGEWDRNQWIERAEQWPWFYADTMLKRRQA